MGLFNFFKSKKNREGEDTDFFKEMEAMVAEAKEKEGTLLDQLPGSTGEFGFSPNNPILITDIAETRKYLEKLIYIKPGASMFEWCRSGSVRSDIVSTPVDKYDLLDSDDNIIKTIYIWSYNKVNSKKVPEGFGLME